MPTTTVKPLTLGLLNRAYTQAGKHRMVVLVMAWFRLGEQAAEILVENEASPKGFASMPPGTPLDQMYPKARGEMLLAAQAYAPEGKPVREMQVRVQLGKLDKTLNVIGERAVKTGLMGNGHGKPKPFESMPLDWSHAYGGPTHPCNALGKGYTGKAKVDAWPNVEYPGQTIKDGKQKRVPAGFGPRSVQCPDLQKHFGTMNREWQKKHAPHLPKDFSPAAFNVAPEDQQLKTWFQGGEAYRLEGMHPQQAVLEGVIPHLRSRLFVQRQGQTPEQAEEAKLNLDTVWFIPHEALGVCLYRTQLDCLDSDGEDITALLAAYEDAQGSARSQEHYRDQLARRTDPETAALLLLNDGPLVPEVNAETLAARKKALEAAEEKELADKQALLDAMEAEFWSGPGKELEEELGKPEDYTPPKAEPSPLGPPITMEALRNGDIDIGNVIAKAEALAEDVKKQGDEKLADLKKRQEEGDLAEIKATAEEAQANAPPEEETESANADLADADLADSDIKEAAERAQLNKPTPFADALEQAKEQGELSPEKEAEIAEATKQMQAAQQQAKGLAVDPILPHMDAKVARWLREQVLGWIEAGEPLAGRDLTGVDLHGLDLSGMDLSACVLENADLRGTKLSGAQLVKTNLVAAHLDHADLSNTDLTEANLSKAQGEALNLSGATMDRAMLVESQLPAANLSQVQAITLTCMQTDFTGACFDGAKLKDSALHELKAPQSAWQGADLEACVLYGADLTEADFKGLKAFRLIVTACTAPASRWDGASLKTCLLNLADLREASFRDLRSLDGSWRNSHLQGSDWRGAGLVRCDLSEAHLQGAILAGAGFGKCLLMRTELMHADARGTDFFQAMLRKADFQHADLREANLVRAQDEGANYEHANLRKAQRTAMGEAA